MHEVTGLDAIYIWHKYPLAIGLQDFALWWQDRNETRKLTSFGKVPEILVLKIDSEEDRETHSTIV